MSDLSTFINEHCDDFVEVVNGHKQFTPLGVLVITFVTISVLHELFSEVLDNE